jgi:hypothetical protein
MPSGAFDPSTGRRKRSSGRIDGRELDGAVPGATEGAAGEVKPDRQVVRACS